MIFHNNTSASHLRKYGLHLTLQSNYLLSRNLTFGCDASSNEKLGLSNEEEDSDIIGSSKSIHEKR